MKTLSLIPLAALLVFSSPVICWSGASYYTARPEDATAVDLTRQSFPDLHGDGAGDDSDCLAQAIARVTQNPSGKGVLLIPSGRYRLSRTISVPPGVRLLGYGASRPVLVLGTNTPGFQEGNFKVMIWFTGGGGRDANPGTFYSALANIDFDIQEGNPAAAAIRSHYAQHCYLAHIDFNIGPGYAGIENVGNEAEDLHFHGGDYGIVTTKPSPSWPFALLDASFDGQRKAAIKTEEGGLTLIRNSFKNVPAAIEINEDRAEELWLKDSRLENITGPALIISDETSPRPEITLENVVCSQTPVLAKFRESGRQVAGAGGLYRVKAFIHGLHIADLGETPVVRDTYETEPLNALPPPPPSDIPALPPVAQWTSILSLGAKGDGQADDTKAIQDAIDRHPVVFFPKGRYMVSESLRMQPDTILIGLNPITTQIALPDGLPAFSGAGAPKGMIESSRGGRNIMVGIGLDSGANNTRANALKWMAGKDSLVDDVRFLGGHGTSLPDGTPRPPYGAGRTGDPNSQRRWDSESYSLWVTEGGGGTFANIWTPSTFARSGVCVSDTSTPGRIYALSSEHHVRNELIFSNAANWLITACQVEEEHAEGPHCLPLFISNCHDLSFANLYLYRVMSTDTPYPNAVVLEGANAALHFHNIHLYGPSKFNFDNTISVPGQGVQIRDREITSLEVSGRAPANRPPPASPVVEPGGKVEKLAGGFNDAECPAVDPSGNVYFVDTHSNRIYRWSAEDRTLSIFRESAPAPVEIAFDHAGNLLVLAADRSVSAIAPGTNAGSITALQPVPAVARPGMTAILPVNRWRDEHDYIRANTTPLPAQILSPDGATFIPVPPNYGVAGGGGRGGRGGGGFGGTSDLTRAYGLAPAVVGQKFYVADEFGQTTWSFMVNPDGSLSDPKKFCEQGECGVTVDASGNVYVAAGNIYVYDPAGRQIDLIRVPDRPSGLVFGGKDGRTLFITARANLYAVRVAARK